MMGNRRMVRARLRHMRRLTLTTLAVLAMFATGCGDDEAAVRSDGPNTPASDPVDVVIYRGSGTVLESPDHGPELCDGVMDSLPPQCSGVPLEGWDWAEVDSEESVAGTTWGSWEVTGTWDGGVLTLTEAPGQARQHRDDEGRGLTTPCPMPAGGWAPVDPTLVSLESQDAAMRAADQLPDVAGTWLDQSINPTLADGFGPGDEAVAPDPALLVINVQVTEDPVRAEAAIRGVWGGALCVSSAERTLAELQAIQDQLFEEYGGPLGVSSGGVDVYLNQVGATAYVATPELTTDIERRFGAAVDLTGLLEPVI